MKISLIQSAPQLNRSNLQQVLLYIEENRQADVVVFSELALSGYLLQDKLFEDAWKIEELEPLALASQKCDIVIGAALWDNGRVYNSALYFSKGRLLHIHHKNYLPTYGMFEEGRYFVPGEEIESFQSPYGRAAMVVCEDLWRAKTMERLASLDLDILYVLAASPARDFQDTGLVIESQWEALLKSASLFMHAYVIFVNRVGFEDGLGFWGGSKVITPMGSIEHSLELFKEDSTIVELNHRLQKLERYLAKYNEG